MGPFWRAMAGGFVGKILAVLFIAICLVFGFGPDKWASFMIAELPIWVTPYVARAAFFSLAAITLFALLGPLILDRRRGASREPTQATGSIKPVPLPADTPKSKYDVPKTEIVNVTPEFLTGLYKDHTNVQGEMLGAVYIGKWIPVSGPLGNVWPLGYTGEREWTKSKRTSQVTFENRGSPTDLSQVIMRFNEDWFERLKVIPQNKNISVLGQITDFNRFDLNLWNCELTES